MFDPQSPKFIITLQCAFVTIQSKIFRYKVWLLIPNFGAKQDFHLILDVHYMDSKTTNPFSMKYWILKSKACFICLMLWKVHIL